MPAPAFPNSPVPFLLFSAVSGSIDEFERRLAWILANRYGLDPRDLAEAIRDAAAGQPT